MRRIMCNDTRDRSPNTHRNDIIAVVVARRRCAERRKRVSVNDVTGVTVLFSFPSPPPRNKHRNVIRAGGVCRTRRLKIIIVIIDIVRANRFSGQDARHATARRNLYDVAAARNHAVPSGAVGGSIPGPKREAFVDVLGARPSLETNCVCGGGEGYFICALDVRVGHSVPSGLVLLALHDRCPLRSRFSPNSSILGGHSPVTFCRRRPPPAQSLARLVDCRTLCSQIAGDFDRVAPPVSIISSEIRNRSRIGIPILLLLYTNTFLTHFGAGGFFFLRIIIEKKFYARLV